MSIAVAIASGILVLASMWTALGLLGVGPDASRVNNRMRYTIGPHPEEVRSRHSLLAQLGIMGMVNIVAGAAAGLGASLYSINGQLRFNNSTTPIAVIGVAIVIVEVSGFVIGYWATRPLTAWITDPHMLEAMLRRALHDGVSHNGEVDDLANVFEELEATPSTPRLKKRGDLRRLGIEAPSAALEWRPTNNHDPRGWAKRIRDELSLRDSWRWAWCRRRLGLVIPLALTILAALTIALLATLTRFSHFNAAGLAILYIGLAAWCVILSWLVTLASRAELVMVNRQAAREAAKLRTCKDLLLALRNRTTTTPSRLPNVPASGIRLSIGRWTLFRAS